MAHVLDPREIADDRALAAAKRELDDLLLGEPLDPAGGRVTELATLIEDYEARRAGYDLAHMRRLLSPGERRPGVGEAGAASERSHTGIDGSPIRGPTDARHHAAITNASGDVP